MDYRQNLDGSSPVSDLGFHPSQMESSLYSRINEEPPSLLRRESTYSSQSFLNPYVSINTPKEASFQRNDQMYNVTPWKNEVRDTISNYPYYTPFGNTSIPTSPFSTQQLDTHASHMGRISNSSQSTLLSTIKNGNDTVRNTSYHDYMSNQNETSPSIPRFFSSPLPQDPYYFPKQSNSPHSFDNRNISSCSFSTIQKQARMDLACQNSQSLSPGVSFSSDDLSTYRSNKDSSSQDVSLKRPQFSSMNSSSYDSLSTNSLDDLSQNFGNGLLYILLHLSTNYDITKCNPRVAIANVELNSNAQYGAKLCYDFLNSGKCRREKKHGSCAYRHLPENHIHAIIERIRSGKQSVCLVQKKDDVFLVADIPSKKEGCVGELNPYAEDGASLCEEYIYCGRCSREMRHEKCPYRHLIACHPERISYLFQHGILSDYERKAWILTPCDYLECNPFAREGDKICHDYVTTGICSRFKAGRICRCRHLLPGHPDRS